MGRHRTLQEKAELKAEATALRHAGVGVRRMAAQLGVSGSTLHELLRDVPAPASQMRLRAKDDHRDAALALRLEGRTYKEIQAELGVSKSSLSLWLRDLPFPTDGQRAALAVREADQDVPQDDRGIARALRADGWLLREIAEELGVCIKTACVWCAGLPVPPRATHGRSAESLGAGARAYWDARRPGMEATRLATITEATARIGPLTEREVDIATAVAYWCEGAKSKPWNRDERLTFINSDPDLIRLFLAWLAVRDVGVDRMRLALSIHESADVDAAHTFWAGVVGCAVSDFRPPTLNRHNPRTVRKNIGPQYVGCLVVGVRGSRDLYREIEGIWRAVVAGAVSVRQTGGTSALV